MTTETRITITESDIEWMFDHSQYWQGAGLAYTGFDHIATGFGWTPRVGFEDACDQIASDGFDTSSLEFPDPEYLDQESLCECGEEDDCEHGYYVTVRFNADSDGE